MDNYIDKLKKSEIRNPNFEKLEEEILSRIQDNKIVLFPKLALAGALAAIFIAAGLYFYPGINQNDTIVAYIMDQPADYSENPVLGYIFDE
ncbi:hypothetical protein A2276_03365 [candidate division WOR-1 bacterium RIFOXYA12_FULL_43_27]|uniref:Uncharacterized protein n=1 Tax=candidate division WOR-1 bacterium RIFOXYC2_FULL_46_14 TaxID=1802587 RepID=A0A1F4U7Q2_UNCSA|nr:MAG: hypothetical protein A2276_03365 [candidate division WOR-1 bacterium RIFOXYA12_FULL_43_27]OGC19260.1 MAG: hypothetical protein A2292_00970 [candidate division WOR-1 bacterium RIFOXYB2_FULL_46_45]OGC30249.1 MAG: hypothetical protein A2232_00970 [candidate division WOR-1 bacterium RIFOXYA2_FULL_46_56]OGC40850.1 MAG: hypothetical protein A2438_00970 [candidate division WOR-1 bacterium RIFOXYC2_FULL_46_14]